jgi:hypothetical protein
MYVVGGDWMAGNVGIAAGDLMQILFFCGFWHLGIIEFDTHCHGPRIDPVPVGPWSIF